MYPLNSVRAFEAAARHGSFSLAAQELSVTTAAVSQHVKKLEVYLQFPLFDRLPKGLLLTNKGQELASGLTDVFLRLDSLIAQSREHRKPDMLTLSVLPIFATQWLLPRLADIERRLPGLALNIHSLISISDFKREDTHAAIRFCRGPETDEQGDLLMREQLVPMCSPGYLARTGGIGRPSDMVRQRLLHDDSVMRNQRPVTWNRWFAKAGLNLNVPGNGLRFSQPDHALQAAIDGMGVVLGWKNMAARALQKGSLIVLDGPTFTMEQAYYLVYPAAHEHYGFLQKFRSWLIAECRRSSEFGVSPVTK